MEFGGGGPGRPIQPRLHDLGAAPGLAETRRGSITSWSAAGPMSTATTCRGEEGADWARFYNEHMARTPRRCSALIALATVPLQDGALAAKVLEEALDAGFPRRDDRDPAEGRRRQSRRSRSLDPFWEVASARKAAIFLHPHYICGDDRLDGYDLINAVGRLADTTIAVARLLFSGHLTRFPGREPGAVACRRRAALCARPAQAQPRDPPRIRRPGGRVSAGSFSTP